MNSEQLVPQRRSLACRTLHAIVGAACDAPILVLVVSFVLVAVSTWAAATRLQYHTSRNDLISPRKESRQLWQNYLMEFGDDDDMVVVVEGRDRDRMKAALDAIAEELAQERRLFDRIFYKVDLRPLADRALMLLPVPQLEAIRRNLEDMKPLLDPDAELEELRQPFSALPLPKLNAGDAPLSWQIMGLLNLLGEANRRTAGLRPGDELGPSDREFFTQLTAIARAASALLTDPATYRNPWGTMGEAPEGQAELLNQPQYFFSGDGTLAFLLCRPYKDPRSFTAAIQPVNALREILSGVQKQFPDLEMGLTGLPVLETDEMAAAQVDTERASLLAIIGVGLLYLVIYRGIAYPLLTIVTLLAGTLWAMGWLTWTVGHLNILSATFAVMLIGMGDYGVLWVMRYEQARQQGMGVREALLHTTTHVAIGNLTAAATLALAFFAAAFADFKAVAELGWIAGCGVLLCALACFTVLPALVMVFDRRQLTPEIQSDAPRLLRPPVLEETWLPFVARRPGWVLVTGLLLTVVVGWNAIHVRYDHNLLHLQAADLDSVKWELKLLERTNGAAMHALSIADSAEQALERKRKFEQLPGVSRVVEVASLVPPDQVNKRELLTDIRNRLQFLPKRGAVIGHGRPDPAAVDGQLTALVSHVDDLLPPGESRYLNLLGDLRAALDRLRGQLRDLERPRAAERLQTFDRLLATDLSDSLHQLRDVSTPRPITVGDLPEPLRERHIGLGGRWLLRVFARDSLWEYDALADFTSQVRSVDPRATGKPFGTVEGLRAMKDGLTRAGLYALLVIVVVLIIDFRRPTHVLIALAPLAMGMALLLGIMGLAGLPLNPANMIGFPLVLGVGIDNGVHILHDWLLRRRAGRPAISHAIGRGVWLKALTTMIGFGALMISTERGLASLGLLLALGVGCCMLTALVFLPAVLHLIPAPRQLAAVTPIPAAPPLRRAA